MIIIGIFFIVVIIIRYSDSIRLCFFFKSYSIITLHTHTQPVPTNVPTNAPTLPPTGGPANAIKFCNIETSFVDCTTNFDNEEMSCTDIPAENQPVCHCDEGCVRELKFTYTGLACDDAASTASIECTDFSPNPINADYSIMSCEDGNEYSKSGRVQQGESIIMLESGDDCLPDCLKVDILEPDNDERTQTFTIDSKCEGGHGLVLTKDYGAFESMGYSCSDTDTHNCIQEVNYRLDVCNNGSSTEKIYEWKLILNAIEDGNFSADTRDLLPLEVSFPDNVIGVGDCASDFESQDVNRCVSANYESSIVIYTGPLGCGLGTMLSPRIMGSPSSISSGDTDVLVAAPPGQSQEEIEQELTAQVIVTLGLGLGRRRERQLQHQHPHPHQRKLGFEEFIVGYKTTTFIRSVATVDDCQEIFIPPAQQPPNVEVCYRVTLRVTNLSTAYNLHNYPQMVVDGYIRAIDTAVVEGTFTQDLDYIVVMYGSTDITGVPTTSPTTAPIEPTVSRVYAIYIYIYI